MIIESTQCCGVMEIDGLSGHKTPAAAMKDFCRQVDVNSDGKPCGCGFPDCTGGESVSGLYTFTGVVGHTDGTTPQNGPYAQNFAAYIIAKKLGTVVAGAEAPNRINHPTHVVRMYSWAPDVEALKRWYQRNRVKKAVRRVR